MTHHPWRFYLLIMLLYFVFWLYQSSCYLCTFVSTSKPGDLEKQVPSEECKHLGMIFVVLVKKENKLLPTSCIHEHCRALPLESRLPYVTCVNQWHSSKSDTSRDLKITYLLAAIGILWPPCGTLEIANYRMRVVWPMTTAPLYQ